MRANLMATGGAERILKRMVDVLLGANMVQMVYDKDLRPLLLSKVKPSTQLYYRTDEQLKSSPMRAMRVSSISLFSILFLAYFTLKASLFGLLHSYHDFLVHNFKQELRSKPELALNTTTLTDSLAAQKSHIQYVNSWLVFFGSPLREIRGTGSFIYLLFVYLNFVFLYQMLLFVNKNDVRIDPLAHLLMCERERWRLREQSLKIELTSRYFALAHSRKCVNYAQTGAEICVAPHEERQRETLEWEPKFLTKQWHKLTCYLGISSLIIGYFHGFAICLSAVTGGFLGDLYMRHRRRLRLPKPRKQARWLDAARIMANSVVRAVETEWRYVTLFEWLCLAEMYLQSVYLTAWCATSLMHYVHVHRSSFTWLTQLIKQVGACAESLERIETENTQNNSKEVEDLVARIGAAHVHYELLMAQLPHYLRLSNFHMGQFTMLAAGVSVICFAVASNRAKDSNLNTLMVYLLLLCALIVNLNLWLALENSRLSDTLTRAIQRLLANASQHNIQLAAPVEQWRRQLLVDTGLRFAPRLFGFALTRKRIIKFDLYLVGLCAYLIDKLFE